MNKMRDLDYEVVDEKARMLRSHRNFAGSDGITRKRTCLCYCNIVIVGLLLLSWILFLWLWVYTKTQGIGSCTTVVEDKVMNQSATLVRIPAELANVDGAFCLDGSVPSYYFKEGKTKTISGLFIGQIIQIINQSSEQASIM